MKHIRTVSLLLAVLLLSTACQAREKETTEQSTADTVITEVTGTDGTTDGTAEPTEAPTAPSSEATEPSTAVTEPTVESTEPSEIPDDPDPESQETVTAVGTYDSVEEVFADYEKRYVTYGSGDNNYDTVCRELIKSEKRGERHTTALIFSDLDNVGILTDIVDDTNIYVLQVVAFDTVFTINGDLRLYTMYDLFGGDVISATDDIFALACFMNYQPILFYRGGYTLPNDNIDTMYAERLYFFTEENEEIKYDWEMASLNPGRGTALDSWLMSSVIANGLSGETIVRHSGKVIVKDGQLSFQEEKVMTLDEWFKACFNPYYNNVDAMGERILYDYKCDTFDGLLALFQSLDSDEWWQLTMNIQQSKEQEGK